MTKSFKGKKILPILILVLCFAIILSSAVTFSAFAAAPTPVGENNTFKVAHISDIHYFPRDLCPWDYNDKHHFALENKQDFKLVAESGTMLNAVCDKIFYQATSAEGLDALIVSGDLTKDGEKRAHIDLANRLRKLQNDVRNFVAPVDNPTGRKANPNFQVFVIPGNHDTYNHDGNTYNILIDTVTGKTKNYVIDKFSEPVKTSTGAYLLVNDKTTGKPINYLKDSFGRPVMEQQGTNTNKVYVDTNHNALILDNITEYNTNKLEYTHNSIAETSIEEFVKIYSGLGYPDFSLAEVESFKRTPVTSYSKNNFGEYYFNTPFMMFENSTNATCYDFTYFKDRTQDANGNTLVKGIKDYAADYAIEFCNLDGSKAKTLQEKERVINQNSQATTLYKNASKLGYCSYIAKPNIDGLKGYDIVMLDSSVRKVSAEGYMGYEHITGGRIMDTVFNWLEDNLVVNSNTTLKDRQDTIISSFHHGTVPHFPAQEPFMNDFVLYDWEEQIVKLTNLGIHFSLTGHVHASDIVSYTANNGETITDIVTGSIISYGAPIRFLTFSRNFDAVTNKIIDTVSDKIQSIVSFKNVTMDYYGGSNKTYITMDTSPKVKHFFGNPENLDKVQPYIYNTTMNTVIPNVLEGYANPELIKGLQAKLPNSDFGVFVNEILTQLVYMQPKYLTKEYPEGVNGEANLFEYLYTAVYDLIGNEPGGYPFEKTDILEDCKFPNLKDSSAQPFTVHDLLRYTYTQYIINGEVKNIDDSAFMFTMKEAAKDGSLAKKVFGDPKTYNGEGRKTGLLYPLLYAPNNLIDQLLEKEITFKESEMSPASIRIAEVLFNLLGVDFKNTHTFTLNELLSAVAKNGKAFDDSTGIVGKLLNDINNGKKATDTLRDFIDKYAVDNFFVNISGILFDVLTSFGVQNKVGYTLNVNNIVDNQIYFADGVVNDGVVYKTNTSNVVPTKEYQSRGITPGMLTLNYGKDAMTSMNLMWNTATFRNSDIKVVDSTGKAVDSSNIVVDIQDIPYGYPIFDIGLLTKLSNETDKAQADQILENGWAKTTKRKRVYKVFITGLKPGETYKYTITTSNDFDANSTYSNLGSHTLSGTFAPAKENGKVTFLGVTDIQGTLQDSYVLAKNNIDTAINNIKATEGNDIDFVVNCGDVVDNGKNIKQWNFALNNTVDYNPADNSKYHTVFSKYPTIVAAGNHESSNNALRKYFNIINADYVYDVENPSSEEIAKGDKALQKSMEKGLYYSYKIANAKFIVLNTNTATANGLEENQYKWLVNELKENVDWKIVVMHKGLYSSSAHANDIEVVALRKQLNSLFYDNDVDIVLQGHDHTFTTSKFLDRNGNAVNNKNVQTDNTFNRPAGVMYITLGTIADKFYEYDQNVDYPIDADRSIMGTLEYPTYCYFTIEGNKMNINWNSLDPKYSNLATMRMTIDKSRGLKSDAGYTSITIKNGQDANNTITGIPTSHEANIITVPYGFNLGNIQIDKGSNVWEKWTIEHRVLKGGVYYYEPIDSNAILKNGDVYLRITIKSEDETNETKVPFVLKVQNPIETKLGDLLNINGNKFKDGLTINKNDFNPVLMDFVNSDKVTITSTTKDEVHNSITYTFTYNGENYMLYQSGYNLGKGNNTVKYQITDDYGNIILYKVGVVTPSEKSPTKAILITVICLVVVLIIINIIMKKVRNGKGLFAFADKYKDKNKNDYYID